MAKQHITNLYLQPNPGVTGQLLIVDDTVGGVQFAQPFHPNTTYVTFDVQEADAYATLDGTAPTITPNGHKMYDTRNYTWTTAMARDVKFIRSGGTDAKIYATELVD